MATNILDKMDRIVNVFFGDICEKMERGRETYSL